MFVEDNVGDLIREFFIVIFYSLFDSDKVVVLSVDQSFVLSVDQLLEKIIEGGNIVREKDVSSIEDYIFGLILLFYILLDVEILFEFEGQGLLQFYNVN